MARRRFSVAAPLLSWVYLDRKALAAARASLEGTFQGVRDELGLGAIHFGYADRFFPGTSVLLTHLRYALFVPWIYNELLDSYPGSPFPEAELRDRERLLGRALMKPFEREGTSLEGTGIIGHTVLKDRAPVVLPSQIYWPSLVRWKIVVDGPDGSEPPMRMAVHDAWENYAPSLAARRRPLEGELERPILFDLPIYRNGNYPADWLKRNEAGIKFDLWPEERIFLADKLSRLQRTDGKECLLAGLAKRAARGETFDNLYSAKVRQLCDEADQAALDRARRAGMLGQFARSIYAALVEELREQDGTSNSNQARTYLKTLRNNKLNVTQVTRLNLDELKLDGVNIDNDLLLLLKRVQGWCDAATPASELLTQFRNRERKKKTSAKARLETRNRDRRKARQQPDWTPGPLTYRWPNVRIILSDLAGTS
jgi:hypothetical protein